MQFVAISAIATALALFASTLAAPAVSDAPLKIDRYVNLTIETARPLAARGGNHFADFYSGPNCQNGNYVGSALPNFGCGGTCYTFDAQSILLGQQTTSGKQPTGTMFYTTNCQSGGRSPQNVGIHTGSTTGCTNANFIQEGFFSWQSGYVYYAC